MTKITKLRLLLTTDCNRDCPGCCNKDWDLSRLPIVSSYTGYDEIMITGGEPLLELDKLYSTILHIREQNLACKIYVYTALQPINIMAIISVLGYIDGLRFTLHEQLDVMPFEELVRIIALATTYAQTKSLSVNIFRGIKYNREKLIGWTIKDNIVWIKDCPLPKGETFMRLE